ncbi:unnamed protein product [Linum trigynum]|uniref:RBR-type E3 ubiquitin transferase n=1 Tax=Linum trigynum TaxID=586398 RepID=A0AAV2FD57_9ROSI
MRQDDSDYDNFAEFSYLSSDDDDDDLNAIESDDQAEFDSDNAVAFLLDELEAALPPELSYSVLTESDIRGRIDDDVAQLSAVLCLPKSEATLILRHFDWDASKAEDSWFADEFKVRRHVGLPTAVAQKVTSPPSDHHILTCKICFEPHPLTSFNSADCGHRFCRCCLRKYIAHSVNDGPRCLQLRCPEPSCKILVGDELINQIADENDRKKYSNFAIRSYVENSSRRKWCPAPNCQHAVEFMSFGDLNYDVSCLCSHSFCWSCSEDKHSPVDCETVKNWSLKNASESQNEMWKKVNTKPCPKCSRAIEKNEGFIEGRMKRYQHYYERWAANEKSRQIAIRDLKDVRENVVSEIGRVHRQNHSQLMFLTEAWEQIVECRRVLKWTYAYGYYLPIGEAAKKQFFEYLQGQAETCLERLHDCAEKEMKRFVVQGSCMHEYAAFRMKLNELTKMCKTYFENLVRALENGLSDVETGMNG